MTKFEIVNHPLIIPTVVIPFAFLLTGLSALATFIAGLFGIRLKAEGPKKLLEVLLKPRVLAVGLISNLAILAAVKGYYYWKNAPVMLWRIESKQHEVARASSLIYPDSDHSAVIPSRPFAKGAVEVVWTKKLDSGSFRGAVISGSRGFVGTDGGWTYETDLSTGETVRQFFSGTAVSALVTVFDGALFVGEGTHDTHHARVYKFDLASGQLAKTFTSEGHIEGEAVAVHSKSGASLMVPTGAGGLLVLDPKTLTAQWQAKDGHVDSAAISIDGRVFSGTGIEKERLQVAKGQAIAYELATGKKLWQRELPASSWMKPIAWKDRICFVFGEVYFASALGGVNCFLQKDGQPDVAYNNAAPIAAAPILMGDDLILSDLNGKVCRVSLADGRARWCRETGAAKRAFANAVLDAANSVLLYPSDQEGLLVLEPDSGVILSKWKAEGQTSPWFKTLAPVAVLSDGWLTVDMNGVMRKLRWKAASETALSQSAAVPLSVTR